MNDLKDKLSIQCEIEHNKAVQRRLLKYIRSHSKGCVYSNVKMKRLEELEHEYYALLLKLKD